MEGDIMTKYKVKLTFIEKLKLQMNKTQSYYDGVVQMMMLK